MVACGQELDGGEGGFWNKSNDDIAVFRGREANGDCLCVSYNLSILGDGEFSGTAHGWGRGDVAHASQFFEVGKDDQISFNADVTNQCLFSVPVGQVD